MTLYMLFAALGTLIYTTAAFAAAMSGVNDKHAAVGVQFALVAPALVFLATLMIFYSARFVYRHTLIAAIALACAVFLAVAQKRGLGEGIVAVTPDTTPAAAVAAESAQAQAAGQKLFHDLDCVGCHRPDGTGIGPSLIGVLGRPITDPGCGALSVDAEYVRESILNPTATVVEGFAPVMPTFAGKVNEDQLRALIAYVSSLSDPVQALRKPYGE